MSAKSKFVIFGQGRSGSTLLVQLLKCHPEIRCDHEILRRAIWGGFLKRNALVVFRAKPSLYFSYKRLMFRNKVYGFKLFNYQVNNPEHTLKRLQDNGWKIFWIHRENLFEQALSFTLGNKTQNWHRGVHEKSPQQQYHIDIFELITELNYVIQRNERIKESLSGLEYHTINYESDLMNSDQWQNTANEIFERLNLESHVVHSTYLKVDPRPLEHRIKNYDEVIRATDLLGIKTNLQIGS